MSRLAQLCTILFVFAKSLLQRVALACKEDVECIVEYQALVPNFDDWTHNQDNLFFVSWVELTYPTTRIARTEDVTMRYLSEEEIKYAMPNWFHSSLMPNGAALTGKVHADNLYVLMNTGKVKKERGCCADTIRIIPRVGSGHRDLDLSYVISEAFAGSPFAAATHTFSITELDGESHALVIVLFQEPMLKNNLMDAVIAVKLSDGSIRPTADGEHFFSFYRAVGTLSRKYADSVWRIQYVEHQRVPEKQMQWHANGIDCFTSADGTPVLAVTQRMNLQAVLFHDPFRVRSSESGGQILQKFGSSPFFSSNDTIDSGPSSWHNFGLTKEDRVSIVAGDPTHVPSIRPVGGIHNIRYHRYSSGREGLMIFVNKIPTADQSAVYEFDLKLVKDRSSTATDEVFATNYTKVPLNMYAVGQGGARALRDGLWLVASGLAQVGLQAVDTRGTAKTLDYHEDFLYDPFSFWVPAPEQQLSIEASAKLATRLTSVASWSASVAAVLLGGAVCRACRLRSRHEDVFYIALVA